MLLVALSTMDNLTSLDADAEFLNFLKCLMPTLPTLRRLALVPFTVSFEKAGCNYMLQANVSLYE
jgi:hypothetical protein